MPSSTGHATPGLHRRDVDQHQADQARGLIKRAGWAAKGKRYRAQAPFGGWKTQTFIAGLRCHGMIAPWIVDAPMNKRRFELYVETQLAPELAPGDVVIPRVKPEGRPRQCRLSQERARR